MARGKYLSLEEARKAGTLKQFAKEHPSQGDEAVFDDVFNRMVRKKPADREASDGESPGD